MVTSSEGPSGGESKGRKERKGKKSLEARGEEKRSQDNGTKMRTIVETRCLEGNDCMEPSGFGEGEK